MDPQTLAAYEADAARHAAFQRSLVPEPIHRLTLAHFHPGAATADIGAGAGRDAAWMQQQGYRVTAYEPAAAMRAEALAVYPQVDLSEREPAILSLLASGLTNAAIADRLALAEGTVKNHVTTIFAKLDVTDRAQATAYAWSHGLVTR